MRRQHSVIRKLIRNISGPVVPEDLFTPQERMRLAASIAGGVIIVATAVILLIIN